MSVAIGKRVRRLRIKAKLSQRQLACPGVTYAYISRIEGGSREPSIKALIKIAERLNTTALYLMTGSVAYCPVCKTRHAVPDS